MIWLAAPAVLAAIYHLMALAAALRFKSGPLKTRGVLPPVSILKPVHGRDPQFYEAIRSHALLDYPEFEILLGLNDPADAAREDIERLAAEFPGRAIRLTDCKRDLPNGKVGVLAELRQKARYPVLVVNDSDIVVESDYLRRVVEPLEAKETGLVTCLYRARGRSGPARWEALGIATDFAPSVLVARSLGVSEFALGSTMAVRAEDLDRIGGFEAVGDYLADDYQLGRRFTESGYRIVLAPTVVETHLSDNTWGQVWRHQLRWARTIRVSRAGGYCGYVITNASVWSVLAVASGWWPLALVCLAIRILAGAATAALVLGDWDSARRWFLIPFRDLWGFGIWAAGLAGSTVEWRGKTLRLDRKGRITVG